MFETLDLSQILTKEGQFNVKWYAIFTNALYLILFLAGKWKRNVWAQIG